MCATVHRFEETKNTCRHVSRNTRIHIYIYMCIRRMRSVLLGFGFLFYILFCVCFFVVGGVLCSSFLSFTSLLTQNTLNNQELCESLLLSFSPLVDSFWYCSVLNIYLLLLLLMFLFFFSTIKVDFSFLLSLSLSFSF